LIYWTTGATCYMATCLQHLYMIQDIRNGILKAELPPETEQAKRNMLYELKKIFIFLLESERKSCNPKAFCKVYTMDSNQPLNTGQLAH
jgi:ubiquitin carboxyl-terminal hydrolase 34